MQLLKKICLSFILLTPIVTFSQQLDNTKTLHVGFTGDTLELDTLSIVPGSISIKTPKGSKIDTTLYEFDYARSLLIKKDNQSVPQQIVVRFKVFPYDFSSKTYHKDRKELKSPTRKSDSTKIYIYQQKQKGSYQEVFGFGGLEKKGSISRGVSFGSNQDLSVRSDLNLQLAGNLNDEVEIKAVITDNNIPIQPEGNTQQIQDFDKVFIQLSKGRSELVAGDYELISKGSHFMRFNKKAQGGAFKTAFDLNKDAENPKTVQTSFAGAISKGKFAKNTLQVIEGNQGPYRLQGSNNESYIIVIAGTEKVFIDGKLIQRGQENDYVIDYNTAEITFTPNVLITKDKRVVVEFEYSDRNYARSMFYTENSIGNEKWNFRVNAYTEQDLKNQPLDLELTSAHKQLLSTIGDSLNEAFFPYFDTTAYSNDRVLYKLTDSVVNGTFFDSILVYSTNPDSAIYEAGFSLVGQGNGNYKQVKSSANGRVFQWVAPISGIPQGTYEPVILIPSPKKKQMVMIASEAVIGKNTRSGIEISLSNNDLNTFSSLNDNNNWGYAAKAFVKNSASIFTGANNKWKLKSSLSHEFINKEFAPIERYRNIEFERDWNITKEQASNENISRLKLLLEDNKVNTVGYTLEHFLKDDLYKGFRNSGKLYFTKYNFHLSSTSSFLHSENKKHTSEFLRYRAKLIKKTSLLNMGIQNESERNRFYIPGQDTLLMNSFSFNEWQAFLLNDDSATNSFEAKYILRNDFMPKNNEFEGSSKGESVSLRYQFQKNPKNRLGLNATYRKLTTLDSLLTKNEPDENFVSRLEYYTKQLKGALVMNAFYEAGTGQEVRKEFSYLEVAAGQGVYKWTDYNANNVKELDEFDVAVYQDEANYIRVYIPTNEYIKTFYNQLNYNMTVDPARAWREEEGLKRLAARFSDQFYYNIRQKSTSENMQEAFNPFTGQINDSILINYSSALRNTVYFNKRSNVFGIDFTFQQNAFKNLLVNGFESREKDENQLNFRWNITREWTLRQKFVGGRKISNSEFFNTRDYEIDYQSTNTSLTFQPSLYFRVGAEFEYGEKENRLNEPAEKVIKKNIGLSSKYSKIGKSTLQARLNYIVLSYNANENTPLAFEMLESLRIGENITWDVSLQRNLSGHLQLGVRYNGRKLPEVNTIHVGSVQLRAYF